MHCRPAVYTQMCTSIVLFVCLYFSARSNTQQMQSIEIDYITYSQHEKLLRWINWKWTRVWSFLCGYFWLDRRSQATLINDSVKVRINFCLLYNNILSCFVLVCFTDKYCRSSEKGLSTIGENQRDLFCGENYLKKEQNNQNLVDLKSWKKMNYSLKVYIAGPGKHYRKTFQSTQYVRSSFSLKYINYELTFFMKTALCLFFLICNTGVKPAQA